ncbi:MAG: ABC transporter permease subunit [Planctomycetes bacterium]|nr:ABC transporter permease subunit [Planctomycetota bacterium]
MSEPTPAAARRRRRATRPGVLLADGLARLLICAGGAGTIIAVMGVCFYLLYVVAPLFQFSTIDEPRDLPHDQPAGLILSGMDDYHTLAWSLSTGGELRVVRLDDGAERFKQQVADGKTITAATRLIGSPRVALGFADGSAQLVEIKFVSKFIEEDKLDPAVRQTLRQTPDAIVDYDQGVLQRAGEGQFRVQSVSYHALTTAKIADAPVHHIALADTPTGLLIGALSGEGETLSLHAVRGRQSQNMLTGEKTLKFAKPLAIPLPPGKHDAAMFLGVAGSGSEMSVAYRDGTLARINLADPASPYVAETGRLFDGDAALTSIGYILGSTTLLWGDSTGAVAAGFPIRLADADDDAKATGLIGAERDPRSLSMFAITKHLRLSGPAMTSFAPSPRRRLALAGFADGSIRMFNITTASTLAAAQLPVSEAVTSLTMNERENELLAATPNGVYRAAFDPRYAEATFGALFTRVWYEGYPAPVHAWQSSSGTSDFEPKLGLIPLVFGTIKATFYAMLFGAPIALLAAVFTSEFLHPRAKAIIKPSIELMASLPSVVLGFLAALVFAPFVEHIVPTAMTLFVAMPLSFLFCAYVWQMLPEHWTLRLASWRLLFMLVPVAIGSLLAVEAGPTVERVLFGGDLKAWSAWGPEVTDPAQARYASAVGGWAILLLPVCAVVVALVVNRTLSAALRRSHWSRRTLASLDMLKFLGSVAAAGAMTWALAAGLDGMGLDPRGPLMIWGINLSPIDTYVQRNALIVGFVMGFAIIPLIYTIADDALSAVPDHLRSASLGAGATPWQTAMRVIVPTAMSGLFSALMIGLGRAVGETMIVLMAAGNTAILDMNIFAGFRTLTANIAVELPEAPKDGTHYRTLFLAALVLFAMTFLVNTVAETVRQRFRKRAYQL